MAETYGELITRLCQLRDAMRATAPGREALQQVRDELAAKARAQKAAGGGTWALAVELERVRAERDAAVSDLKKAARWYHFCDFCGRRGHVDALADSCATCRRQSNYSWRGMREE